MIRALLPVVAWLALAAPAQAHGSASGALPTDALGIALAWHLDFPIILGLLGSAAIYLSAVSSVDEAHPSNRWPRGRSILYMLAIVAIGLALLSPLDTLADDLLTVHMFQHLLLVAVAPPLLAASGVGTLALRAASRVTRDRHLLPFLHSRLVSALTFPLVGWLALPAVMWGTHFTQVYDLALVDDGVHAIEHLLYFAAASLFWVAPPVARPASMAAPPGSEGLHRPDADAGDEPSRHHDHQLPGAAIPRIPRALGGIRNRHLGGTADRRLGHVVDRPRRAAGSGSRTFRSLVPTRRS